MDPEIKELKELVRQNTKVAEDTNRVVHKMQRSARWSMVLRMVWWLTLFGITSAIYFYFLAPYLDVLGEYKDTISSFFERFSPSQPE